MALQPLEEEEKVVDQEVIGVPSDYSNVDNTLSSNPQDIAEAYAAEDEKALDKHKVVLADRNDKFSVEDFYVKKNDGAYDNYLKQRNKAIEAQDADKLQEWDNYYTGFKAARDTYSKFNECTLNGDCEEGNEDYYNLGKNATADWKYTDQVYNQDLTKSLRKTYGNFKHTGEEYKEKELIDMWMADQAFTNVNVTKLGIDAASMLGMTEQQKKDFALQFMTYQKIAATGEGSRDGFTQTTDTLKGLVADPANWGILATFGITLLPKEAARAGVKKGIQHYLNKFLASNATKTAGITGSYTGLDNAARQAIKIQGGAQDGFKWGEFAVSTGVGAALGGSLGMLLGGASTAFNNLANKYMIKNKIGDRKFLQTIRDNVTDEKSLYKFLKNLGWTRKEAKEEISQLNKGGFKFDAAEKKWVSSNQEYKPPVGARNTEVARHGEDVNKVLPPKPLQREGQKQLDKEYIDVSNIDLQIPFSKSGQNFFDWVNRLGKTVGPKVARTIYGSDSILVRSGLRREAKALNDAMAATDINVARMSNTLKDMAAKNEQQLGDLNALVRDRKVVNKEQKEFLSKLDDIKDNQMRMAFNNKVITAEDYTRFKSDKSYIPRVWNSQHLLTDKGAGEFSEFMIKLWKKDPKGAKAIIKNITGKSTDDAEMIINSHFAPGRVQDMFRNKMDREIDVHRSSHLEFDRKIELPAGLEHMLDGFMAKPLDRWSKFFEDVVKRNEFARRFGAKDQYIHKRIKTLENQGKGKEADHLRETYFTTMGDPKFSKTVKEKMDNPVIMKGIAKINAFQNLKLGLAAIPNATQAFVNGTVKLTKSHGLIKAPFYAMNGIVRAIVKTKSDLDIINRAGVLGEIDLARIATENMPHARIVEREFTSGLQFLNEPTKFLRAVGFTGVEEMNRRAAAIMAHGHVASLHNKLKTLIAKGKGNSAKASKLDNSLKKLGITDPRKADLSSRDYAVSGHMFNKQVNFSGESFNLPSHWQTPWMKLMTKFKSFMFYQARFLKREVSDELFHNNNAKPLVAYLLAAGVAGNAAEMARAFVQGKELKKNRNAIELLIAGIGNAGGGGLWWDTMKQISDQGTAGAFGILGPTASDVANTIQDISNADLNRLIKRALPNIPGKNQLMDSFKY